jgi:UDP-glucuronate decarboxylase
VEFTIFELATTVKELAGSKSEIVFQPFPQDDPVRRRPDISLAKEKLRWEPTIPLRDGLTRTIDYFRSHLGVLPE